MVQSKPAHTIPEPFATLLALVLPAPERDQFLRQASFDVAFWSAFVGLFEFIGGGLILVHDGMTMLQAIASNNAATVMADGGSALADSDNAMAYMLSGSLNAFTWFFTPTTWLMASVPLVGMVRLVAFAGSREPCGELFVWIVVRISRFLGRRSSEAAKKTRFGPRRPDRLIQEPGYDLVLLTSTEQPDWNEWVTVEIHETFYTVVGHEERRVQGEAFLVHAYKMREMPANAIIRRLYQYEPYVGRGSGT